MSTFATKISSKRKIMISIILTLHNQEKSIISALQSLVAQTVQQWECIIIDNASTDASDFQVRSYLFDRRMRYVRLDAEVPLWSARHKGLELTSGEWIVYMDGADYLKSNALQALYLAVKKYGTLCGASNYAVMRGGEPVPNSYRSEGKIQARDVLRGEISVVTGSSIFSRSIAHLPDSWKTLDFAYTDHLVAIYGEGGAPLIKVERKPWWRRWL